MLRETAQHGKLSAEHIAIHGCRERRFRFLLDMTRGNGNERTRSIDHHRGGIAAGARGFLGAAQQDSIP